MHRVLIVGISLIAVAALGLTVWSLASGGSIVLIAGQRLTLHNPARPFFAAGVAALLLVTLSSTWRSIVDRVAHRLAALPGFVLLAPVLLAAGVALLIGWRDGSFVAAAADSYSYVSQAELWVHGVPRVEQPLAVAFPWPHAQLTLSPLGYRPSIDGQAIVPVNPTGYPLLMAAMLRLFGQGAQYVVVPATAALTIVIVFLLGRRVAGPWAGLMAATLLSVSPAFLFHACVPMSDMPATMAWAAALLLILRATVGAAFGSGFFVGAAILIRPQLAPLAALVVLLAIIDPFGDRHRPRRAIAIVAAFMCGTIPAIALLAVLNSYWYGSPLASGYASLSSLFSLSYVPENIRHYAGWLSETQTVAIFLAPLALFTTTDPRARACRVGLLCFVAGVAACYMLFAPVDNWTYLRYLLPAYPALLVLFAALVVELLARLTKPVGVIAAIALVGTIALSCVQESRVKGVFVNWLSTQRFVDVSHYAKTNLPANAIYLTRLYSGSLRYYGDRPTIRWDVMDPDWLERAIVHLRDRGFLPLIVIEDGDDEHDYQARFRGTAFGALDWPPIAEYHSVQTVRIFDPSGRSGGGTARAIGRIPVSADNHVTH
jgi:hypothetical protein